MSVRPSDAKTLATSGWPWPARLVVSVFLVAHFGMLALNYASNNSFRRSSFADETLIKLQPYLITLGWYTELVPISLVTGETFDQPMTIEYKTDPRDTNWKTWIDSRRTGTHWRRLSMLAAALAEHEDSDGLGLMAHAMVARAAQQGTRIQRIRFAMEVPSVSSEPQSIYEASVVQLSESDITLVPQIEATRSVPAIPSTGGPGR